MSGAIRLLFDPVAQEKGGRLAVHGGTLRLFRMGSGTTKAKLDSPQPATLTFHAAYLANARVADPEFEPFAKLHGKLLLKDATRRPVFVLEAESDLEYLQEPSPDAPPAGQIALRYAPVSFENIPPEHAAICKLLLPPSPPDAKFLELGVELEVDGAKEAALAANDRLDVPLGLRLLITEASPYFAPGPELFNEGDPAKQEPGESCIIHYSVSDTLGQITAARLEVARKKSPDEVIARVPLTAEDMMSGDHTLAWDGQCTEGEYAGQYLNALGSPYVLRIVAETPGGERKARAETAVRVVGLRVARAPLVSPENPPAPKSDAFYQLRLSELGFHTGPVDGVIGQGTKRALKEFQRTHAGLKPTGTLDTYTKAYLDETAPPGTGLDHYQFILNYIGYGAGAIDGLNGKKTRRAVRAYRAAKGLGAGDALDAATKASLDAEVLAPLARIEVLEGDLTVANAIENPLPAPGSEKKLYIYCDGSISPGSLPYGEKYKTEDKNLVRPHLAFEVQPLVLKSDDTMAFAPAAVGPARINLKVDVTPPPADLGVPDPTVRAFVQAAFAKDGAQATTGHHVHKNRGGVRSDDDAGVLLVGKGLPPHEVKKDAPVHYVTCSTADDSSRGRAAAFLVPSTIAGDRTTLIAELDPEGFDTPPAVKPSVTVGTLVNWRRYNICKLWFMDYVPRPHRTTTEPQLGLPRWYEPAFIEFVEPVAPAQLLIQPRAADHAAIDLPLFTALLREAGYPAALLTDAQIQSRFAANILWPLPPAAIYNAHNEQAYYDAIDSEIFAFEERFSSTLRELSRLESPDGLMVLVFDKNAPRAGTLGVHAINNLALQSWSWSLLASTGAIHLIFDQDTGNPAAIDGETLAHEVGHALWLHHASTSAGSLPYAPDQAEHNPAEYESCTMSYVALPKFCGKCVLKLRGWDESKV